MGNEMSAEADDQALNAGFDIHQLEPAVSNAVAQVCNVTGETVFTCRSRRNLQRAEKKK